jgi:digeranylgeranylglycerophospholipid reductase
MVERKMEKRAFVIGGGPAGLTAARILKENNDSVEVLLFESGPRKYQCGEAISRDALEKNNIKLPEYCIGREVKKVTVRIGNIIKTSEQPGYMIYRKQFNQTLENMARTSGVQVFHGHEVRDIRRKNAMWELKIMDKEAKKLKTMTGDMIIGAGGCNSRVALLSKVVSKKEHDDWLKSRVFAHQYKMESDYRKDELLIDICRFLNPQLVGGDEYWYAFYHHDNITNVGGVVGDPNAVPTPVREGLLKGYIEKKLGIAPDGYKIKERLSGYIATRPLPRTYSDGVIICGEEGVGTSLLYSGLRLALTTGRLAGEVAAETLKANDVSQQALKEYEDKWKSLPFASPIFTTARYVLEKYRTGQAISQQEESDLDNAFKLLAMECW